MKTYTIEIGNFKGEMAYKFSSEKTTKEEVLNDFVNKNVILGTSKFLKSVFLGENARMNTDQQVTIVEFN